MGVVLRRPKRRGPRQERALTGLPARVLFDENLLWKDQVTRDTKAEVEQALAVIVDGPFSGGGRAVDMEMFSFGRVVPVTNRNGDTVMSGEYALHVQCSWHLERSGALVTGYRDLFLPASGEERDDDFDWESYKGNLRDKLIEEFFRDATRTVERIEAGETGTLAIFLSGDSCLRLFPDRTGEVEHWRFFRVGGQEPHLVLTTGGVSFD